MPDWGMVLCGLGFHKWSISRQGVQICIRYHCKTTRLYGFAGERRLNKWKSELYEEYLDRCQEDRERSGGSR